MKFLLVSSGEIEVLARKGGDTLFFKDAVLGAAEMNRNRDVISVDGVRELASSISGTPIDIEHNLRKICGVFTRGEEIDGKLVVDGIIWAGRYPREAEKVMGGQMSLSLYASAEKALCPNCNKEFSSPDEYCACLASEEGVRVLKGLKAKGGALTENPASPTAGFDTQQIFVVSSLRLRASWWSKYYDSEGEIPDSAFVWLSDEYSRATPDEREKMNKSKHRKLPVRRPDGSVDPDGWKAAWAAVHGARGGLDTAGGPTKEEVIERLKNIKPKEIEVKESEQMNEIVEKLKAEIEAMRKQLEEAALAKAAADDEILRLKQDSAKVEAQAKARADAEAELAAANEKIKSLVAEIRALKLAGLVPAEQIKANTDKIAQMSDEAFGFLLSAVKANRDSKGAGLRIDDSAEKDTVLTL